MLVDNTFPLYSQPTLARVPLNIIEYSGKLEGGAVRLILPFAPIGRLELVKIVITNLISPLECDRL